MRLQIPGEKIKKIRQEARNLLNLVEPSVRCVKDCRENECHVPRASSQYSIPPGDQNIQIPMDVVFGEEHNDEGSIPPGSGKCERGWGVENAFRLHGRWTFRFSRKFPGLMANKVIQVIWLHVPEVDQLVYTKQDSDPISGPVNDFVWTGYLPFSYNLGSWQSRSVSEHPRNKPTIAKD